MAETTNLNEEAKRQAMDIATPEFRLQVNAVEESGNASPVNPTDPAVGVESGSIDRLPDPLDAQAVENFRQEKQQDLNGPGE